MPLAETQEGNTIQDPQSGQWITVTRTAEGTTSVIHKYSDGARRTCFPNRLPAARATTPSSNERFKDKRTNGEWFRSCVLPIRARYTCPVILLSPEDVPAFKGRGGFRPRTRRPATRSQTVTVTKCRLSDGRWCRRHRKQ